MRLSAIAFLPMLGGCTAPAPTAEPFSEPPAAATRATTTPITHALTVGTAACVDPTRQVCDPPVRVTLWTEDRLVVEFTASTGHCSPVIAHLDLDGERIFSSAPLEAGSSIGPQDFGPVPVGEHVVELRAEGVTGGCNSGGLGNWGGTLVVGIAAIPGPYPTPRLETPAP